LLHNIIELNEQSQIWRKASLDITKMKRMTQSGFGFWKILAILMVIVTIGSCVALTSAVDVVSESNRNTSPATSYMPDDYSLIRVGVNNVSLGDVIVVYNETYEENVTVNRLGALVVQMNNLTDSRTSVSGWETAKIITLLSTDTDSIQLISVTPPAGTTLQRGSFVPFEVIVDYNLESVATGFVSAALGLPDGSCVFIGGIDEVEVTQGHGTAVIRGSIDVDFLYDWLQSDTAYLQLSLGYWKEPRHFRTLALLL
jgi:hypothetical protein